MENQLTVSDLQLQNKLKFRRGAYNILDCGIRTGKTYWAINNLKQFTRDGRLNRILFLTDTTNLKNAIITEYSNECVEVDDMWIARNSWGEQENKIGIMCYQALAAKAVKDDLEFLEEIDAICWDECDSIFDFAVDAFAIARKTDYARKNISNAEVLNAIQTFSSNQRYSTLVLLGAWEKIIKDNRIMCIGLSASPERANQFYQTLVSASYEGKLETGYRESEAIYYKNLLEHVELLNPEPDHGYWCYSPRIDYNKAVVRKTSDLGFNSIELHSENNSNKPLDAEQRRVLKSIIETGMVPEPYDFVIVTKALMRGINILDKRFDRLIIDSYVATDRLQAGRQTFPYKRHLKIYAPEIPEEYLNRWLTVDECRELAEYMAVPEEIDKNNNGKILTWNRLKEALPEIGYTVEGKRKRLNGSKNAQQCYLISGEWKDVIISEKGFLELATAKMKLEETN